MASPFFCALTAHRLLLTERSFVAVRTNDPRIAGLTTIIADNRPLDALVLQRMSDCYTHGAHTLTTTLARRKDRST